ncbi:MAG: hypothetical protein U5N86_07810 [Planctomycetota bacterium]|nr:hypothetical protein [Planctomycetota bacterium]
MADTGQFLHDLREEAPLMEALSGHYGSSTTGIYGGLPQEIADPVAKDASVLLFFRTKFWPDSLRDIPSSNGRRILFGLKFFAGSLIIDCTDEPGLYMPQFTRIGHRNGQDAEFTTPLSQRSTSNSPCVGVNMKHLAALSVLLLLLSFSVACGSGSGSS